MVSSPSILFSAHDEMSILTMANCNGSVPSAPTEGSPTPTEAYFLVKRIHFLAELTIRIRGIECLKDTLRVLSLHICCTFAEDRAERPTFPTLLAPLLSCKQLVQVIIHAPDGVLPGNTSLRAFAQSWPLLEKLELRSKLSEPEVCISLFSLSTLAQFCKYLRTVTVAVNMTCLLYSNSHNTSRTSITGLYTPAPALTRINLLTHSIVTKDQHSIDLISRLWPNAIFSLDDQDFVRTAEVEDFVNDYNSLQTTIAVQAALDQLKARKRPMRVMKTHTKRNLGILSPPQS